MQTDKTDTCNNNNIINHPAQPTLRHRLLQAIDGLANQPTPADQHAVLLKIAVLILAAQLVVSLVHAAH